MTKEDKAMRKFIMPVQFIIVMVVFVFNSYAEQPREKITNSLGMEFVLIQPGQFMMGSPEDEPGRYSGEKATSRESDQAFLSPDHRSDPRTMADIDGKEPCQPQKLWGQLSG